MAVDATIILYSPLEETTIFINAKLWTFESLEAVHIFVTMQPELWHKKCQNGFYLFLFFRNWGFCDKTCKAETLPSKLQELKLDVGKEKKM